MTPEVFPLWRVLLTAVAATILGLGLLRWRLARVPLADAAIMAALSGAALAAFRLAANIPVLNVDPIAGLSPNDLLAPLATYPVLALYLDLAGRGAEIDWRRARAALVLAAFLANVFTI